MATQNRDLSTFKSTFVSQLESGASNTFPVYRAPQSKTSYVKKIIITNNTGTSGTFDIGLYDSSFIQGGNVFVATDNSYTTSIYSSTDGLTWTTRTLPDEAGNTKLNSSAYGNGVFVATTARPNSTYAVYSTDAITWKSTTTPALDYGNLVVWTNDRFIVTPGYTNTFISSTNGVTWTLGSLPITQYFTTPAYGNGTYVILGDTASGGPLLYSTDAITWTAKTMPDTFYDDVIFGNGIFVATNSNTLRGARSIDGITWSGFTFPIGPNYLAYGNGTYVGVDSGSTSACSSLDTITWTIRTLPASRSWQKPTFGSGKFVTLAYGSTARATSTDGITWTLGTMAVEANYSSVSYPQNSDFSNDRFLYKSVTVAANTTQSISYQVMVAPTEEIRVRSTVPMQVTVMGEV
jgi:hypothetical protein